ncbi:DUF1835 domain-containing protein [Paenibacillus cremeus]|uniref:DUF1835 domain-containing protein n=1 Tax=Paenibacillus cremeus TaxID=2163881 RepID=A0A559KB76_9BACL|nr:DUF1835 domain-containing protein [Paenibacillus cremeus]TVY09380.1 DUF1835 domain-containing protein [Paenibacillus cremeus]
MLHIVNGDSFGETLREVLPEADILVWRESLYEGPLSVEFTDQPTREAREQYFTSRGVPGGMFKRFTEVQETALTQYHQHDEVVLWFEHDLFDQTMLIYLLQWFSRQNLEGTKLSLLCINSFPEVHPFKGLGQLNAEQTASLLGSWREVSADQLHLAREAWFAYAGDNPTALVQLLQKDLTALPFLRSALLCHLQRYPSVTNGLNALETAVLSLVLQSLNTPISLFQQIGNLFLDYGLGDVQFWAILEEMRGGEHPLLVIDGPTLPNYGAHVDYQSLQQTKVYSTELGQQALRGESDYAALNGLNRWLGGVYLTGHRGLWRWNQTASNLDKH